MRTFTPNDKAALLAAFRVFVRALSGERLLAKKGMELIEKALDAGLTIDALLNKGNWERALEAMEGQEVLVKDYVEMMVSRRIVVLNLSDEPMWNEPANRFGIIAEAVHDYFQVITGYGGKWNIPSFHINVAKAIKFYSLQAILSEELILRVTGASDEKMFCFGYVQALVKDYGEGKIEIDLSLSEAQEAREKEDDAALASIADAPDQDEAADAERKEIAEELQPLDKEEAASEDDDERQVLDEPEEDPRENPPYQEENFPEDDPCPDEEPENDREENLIAQDEDDGDTEVGFETILLGPDPRETKRDSIRLAIENCTLKELLSLSGAIEDGDILPVSEIVDRLTDGQFDTAAESAEAREVHQALSADLLQSFIGCVQSQQVEMNEELASSFDILHDSWDFRTRDIRVIHKLKRLIVKYGKDDVDLDYAMRHLDEIFGDKQ